MSKTPKFEKRHFEFLAIILKTIDSVGIEANIGTPSKNLLEGINKAYVKYFASRLEETNPNFDKEKFMEACINDQRS